MSTNGADAPLIGPEDIRTLERLSLSSLDATVAGLFGQREGRGTSAGLEFADYRRYTPGDDVRRIDWNIYARLHELHVRTAPQQASLWLSVLLDASRSMDSGDPNKLRYGRRLAALLATVALLRSDSVEIHTLSDGESASSGSFDSGAEALGIMVDELGRLPAGRTTQLQRSIRASRASGWEPELAVLISDGLVARDDLRPAILELARGARAAAFVHVFDPHEEVLAWTGSTLLVDRETGRQVDATITPETQALYAQRFARLRAELEQQCRAFGVNYVAAPTTLDPLEFLISVAREQSLLETAQAG